MTNVQENREQLIQPRWDTNLIYHCSGFNVGGNGGAETYLTSLIKHKQSGVSDRIIKSLKNVDQSQFKLLHIHSPDLLFEVTGECPVVFTVHNHSPYCPSGTKYLARTNTICNRNFSFLGCVWGKFVDSCGTRRPGRILEQLQGVHQLVWIMNNMNITFLANSDYVRKQLIQHGAPPQQTLTLYCGIELPETPVAPLSLETHNNHRILFVGRIVPDKGLEWLLKSLPHTNSRVHLDIAGEGWERPRLEKMADKLGLNDRITWHGWCSRDQLDTLYQECFAVIFPSIWPEPAGLVTPEAYARYRPVIASAVGGIPEHIQDQETGILIPANNMEKLAQAINELDGDYHKSRSIGEAGHKLLMQKFTMDVHVKNLQKIYEKTLSEFSPKKD